MQYMWCAERYIYKVKWHTAAHSHHKHIAHACSEDVKIDIVTCWCGLCLYPCWRHLIPVEFQWHSRTGGRIRLVWMNPGPIIWSCRKLKNGIKRLWFVSATLFCYARWYCAKYETLFCFLQLDVWLWSLMHWCYHIDDVMCSSLGYGWRLWLDVGKGSVCKIKNQIYRPMLKKNAFKKFGVDNQYVCNCFTKQSTDGSV